MKMKPLTVYKASAGSGKTFTLAVEYIKLLIENPFNFRSILAVTFTNKATEEMKARILGQLYGIWKQLPDSTDYMDVVTSALGINWEQASRQAGIALELMIHNYGYFRVETIDTFFQSVLRNLARELDLTANLRIGLNDTQVEEQAVDQIIDSIKVESDVLKWLISYIFSNINDNKGWNVIGQIKQFGQTIFKDYYKSISKILIAKLSEPGFFENYVKRMQAIKRHSEKRMSEFADVFEEETAKAGLTLDSYSGKRKGIPSYFNKLRSKDFSDARCDNSTLRKCIESSENWASKTSKERGIIIDLAEEKLIKLLKEAEAERKVMWPKHATADATLRHLNKLRLLNVIDTKVRELNEEANRFLLSDTQYLLHTLINDSDSPFIFEKAGCLLEHIMIDEFQDTSTVQWQNFKVLLKECMSHSTGSENTMKNLIVGDVKQSIYRWRSGDWRLLNDIESQFEHPVLNVGIRNLHTNFRSERRIVEFNNAFFKAAATKEYENEQAVNGEDVANEVLKAYADVCQKAREGKGDNGYVKIALLPDKDYGTRMLETLMNTVTNLLDAGIKQRNIAILIRYNKHIPLIADYFMKNYPEAKLVSDEAFRLDASLAVNTIVQALQLTVHPEDVLTMATLATTYQKRILKNDISYNEILSDFAKDNTKAIKMLPQSFIENLEKISKDPLIDTVEQIYSSFNLSALEGQSAYICNFFDRVSDFIKENSGNAEKFIKEWNDNLHNETIQCDEVDGIRLISIHKSKGLEFDNVIIPFCDWTLENRNTTLWCKTTEEPFSDMPIVPVDSGRKLLETFYADGYKDEHIQNCVDNLNLLYVAFTRASKNLFVFGRRRKPLKGNAKTLPNNRSELLEECIPDLEKALHESITTKNEDEEEPITFEYGTLYKDNDIRKENKSSNVFMQSVEQRPISMPNKGFNVTFKQSNKSKDFIESNDGEKDKGRYIKIGNIMHKLFSEIRSTEDIDDVLRQFEFEGIIYEESITPEKIRTMLSERLANPQIAEWFSPKWKVFNECGIVFLDKATDKVIERRPDRVIIKGKEVKVIDFKFGNPKEEYKQQVRQYVNLLKDMGYEKVEGYLWFVYTNKIDKIEA